MPPGYLIAGGIIFKIIGDRHHIASVQTVEDAKIY